MGMDIAGTVVEVGPGIMEFAKGDRVAAIAPALTMQKKEYGGFQLYTVVPTNLVSRIPDNIAFTEAAVLPLGLVTAANGLFEPGNLGLKPPSTSISTDPAANEGKAILIWGGSGSVGSCAI